MYSKFRDIYAIANRLGLEMLPSSASDEEQIQNIAEQLGLDYDGSPESESEILDTLYDMENEDLDPFDNGYDENRIDDYGENSSPGEGSNRKNLEKGQQEADTDESSSRNNDDLKKENNENLQEDEDPTSNGYDPNRQTDTVSESYDTTTGNDVNTSGGNNVNQNNNGFDSNNKNLDNQDSGLGDNGDNLSSHSRNQESNQPSLSKPGDSNPNNDVNKNGASPNVGNGYNSQTSQNAKKNLDAKANPVGNRNFQHNQKVQKGKQAESAAESAKKSGSNNSVSKASNAAKSGSGSAEKVKSVEKKLSDAKRKAEQFKKKQKAKKATENLVKLWGFLLRHPYLLFAIILIILFIIIIITIISDEDVMGNNGGNGAMNCTYNLSGVTSSGEVELSGMKVELINCDGSSSNYQVLANVDFEKYVLGVALAEIGPDAPAEALKAQIVAARNFALTRNSGMCPGNPDNCFYGYNASTGKIRMRACEADQVYWDYDNIIYRQDRGAISLYSPEISSGTVWKSPLNDTMKAEIESIANEVKGKVLLDESGNVYKTNYDSTVTDQFTAGANSGKTYLEILNSVYTGSSSDVSSAKCARVGNIDYGDYTLSSDGHTILHQPLDQFLSNNGSSLESFNKLIEDNVEDAGFGTRAGVVAAAVTLIGELGDKYGVKVPYYWGGGHYDGVVIGAHHYWGSDPDCTTYAHNQTYDYCGLDCSGFVPWAIKNGGFGMNQLLAGDFKNVSGAQMVTLKSDQAVLQPGDLLESDEHVVLVVGIDEDANQYICAEASGNQYGVLFTRRTFKDSGYWGVNMDGYYSNSANIRSK